MLATDVTSRFQGWLQAAHPFPMLMVVLLTGLVGYTSAAGHPDFGRLTAVVLAMLLSQLCIGWSNDYVDREKDALFQPFKPVPSGQVSARLLPVASLIAMVLSLAVGAWLGWLPLVFLAIGTASGLAYNFRLKESALSWLPYVIAFAVLPPFVWSALDSYADEFFWLYPIGFSLTVAAHLANILPDIETDTAAGTNGIGVVLGRGGSLTLLALCMLAPLPLVALSTIWVNYVDSRIEAALAIYAALLLVSFFAYRLQPFGDGAILGFRFVVAACVFFAGGWLASL